jgi:hypothetical protein
MKRNLELALAVRDSQRKRQNRGLQMPFHSNLNRVFAKNVLWRASGRVQAVLPSGSETCL